MIASYSFNPASDPALLDFTPPAIAWLQAQPGEWRYITLEDPVNTPQLMNANMTMRYGLRDVRGYESIIPKQYVDYMQTIAPQVQLAYNRIAPIYTTYGDGFDPTDSARIAAPRRAQRALRRQRHGNDDRRRRLHAGLRGRGRAHLGERRTPLPLADITADSRGAVHPYPATITQRQRAREIHRRERIPTNPSPRWSSASPMRRAGAPTSVRWAADEDSEQQVEVSLYAGNLQLVQLPARGRLDGAPGLQPGQLPDRAVRLASSAAC